MSKTVEVVALAIIENRKLLVARNKGKTVYYLPGGKREKGENDMQTLLREVREELNLVVDPSSVTLFAQYVTEAYGEGDGVMVDIRYYLGKVRGTLTPQAEIDEVRYITKQEYLSMKEQATATTMLFTDLKKANLID